MSGHDLCLTKNLKCSAQRVATLREINADSLVSTLTRQARLPLWHSCFKESNVSPPLTCEGLILWGAFMTGR